MGRQRGGSGGQAAHQVSGSRGTWGGIYPRLEEMSEFLWPALAPPQNKGTGLWKQPLKFRKGSHSRTALGGHVRQGMDIREERGLKTGTVSTLEGSQR